MENEVQRTIDDNQLSRMILDAAFKVHTRTGPGLLESVYETILVYELRKAGLQVDRQVAIPLRYDCLVFDEGFRADVLVEKRVIVELKSVGQLTEVHSKQVLTQLRLSDRTLGLLINFGEVHLKNGIQRITNGAPNLKTRIAKGSVFSSRPSRPSREAFMRFFLASRL